MPDDELERSEIEAVLETRRELGVSYDAALVDSFADRIERAVQQRSEETTGARDLHRLQRESAGKRQLALGLVSVIAGIPITLPLGLTDNLPALVISWLGIVGVNAAHAATANRSRD